MGRINAYKMVNLMTIDKNITTAITLLYKKASNDLTSWHTDQLLDIYSFMGGDLLLYTHSFVSK